jgi:hypothetical protein
MSRIVSSTGDAAASQIKLNHLIEESCSMHLGVNLRCAQVKAMNNVSLSVKELSHNEENGIEFDDHESECSTENGDNSEEYGSITSDNESLFEDEDQDSSADDYYEDKGETEDIDVKSIKRVKMPKADVDHIVYEVCKLFGRSGSPEYGDGSAFYVFLCKECNLDSCEYYEDAKLVKLKRQIGSRFYITSYNSAQIFFLQKAMVDF